jgi:hypothetical protein
MNSIQTIHTQYIRYANRSLDTVKVVSEMGQEKTLWIYNFEGIHFRVFGSEKEAWNLLDNKADDCLIDFDKEEELERFLVEIEV